MKGAREIFGEVKRIHTSNEYGFIKSNSGDFYFKLKDAQNKIKENDRVRFVANSCEERQWATCIRKVFINREGIQFVPRINSSHLHDDVDYYLPELINNIENLDGQKIIKQVDFPGIIGESSCIPFEEDQPVTYAIRKGRVGHSRIVYGLPPVKSSSITVVLLKVENFFIILSCYIGQKSEVEP